MSRQQRHRNRDVSPDSQLSVFPSQLGWFGIVGTKNSVTALTFGHGNPAEVHERFLAGDLVTRQTSPGDWWPELQVRLQAYAAGSCDDFADIVIQGPTASPFQSAVVTALRQVRYGELVTYGELAALAGSPHAARAVGRVMATNLVPIIIPCHRVIASGGRIGGYSAPSGLVMKQRLLQLEGVEPFWQETLVDAAG